MYRPWFVRVIVLLPGHWVAHPAAEPEGVAGGCEQTCVPVALSTANLVLDSKVNLTRPKATNAIWSMLLSSMSWLLWYSTFTSFCYHELEACCIL